MTQKLERRAILAKYIDKLDLPERWREIINFRYGLDVVHTMEETGKQFGIKKQRVQQIEKRVFEMLGDRKV